MDAFRNARGTGPRENLRGSSLHQMLSDTMKIRHQALKQLSLFANLNKRSRHKNGRRPEFKLGIVVCGGTYGERWGFYRRTGRGPVSSKE